MSSEALKKFKDDLDRFDTIAVSLGSSPGLVRLLSGAIVHTAFIKLGKKSFLKPSDFKENTKNFLKILLNCPENATPQENILIRVDTKKTLITDLKYEKDGDILKIILGGKGLADTSNVSVGKQSAPVDLLVLIDPKDTEIEETATSTPHKEVVRLSAKEQPLTNKIHDLLYTLFDKIPEEFTDALHFLADLEDNLSKLPPDLGYINKEKIASAKEALFGKGYLKLTGRALARSEFENNSGIFWSCLTKKDLEKTASEEASIPAVYRDLRNLRPGAKFYTLLWEKNTHQRTISALVGSNDINSAEKLAQAMGSSLSSLYFLTTGYNNFSEAEKRIRSSIQQILLNTDKKL